MDYQDNGAGLLVPMHGHGVYTGTIIRGGHFDADGVWHRGNEIIDHWVDPNLVVDQGLNSMLGVYLHADTQLPNWYCGLFSSNSTPASSWTAANLGSNCTEATGYSSSTRVAYTPGAASGKAITNSASRATFVFNTDLTIYGAFLISDSAKSGTSGTLFSAARFSASKTVANLDELLLTYAFSLASS